MKKLRDSKKSCTIQLCPNTLRLISAYSAKYSNCVELEVRTKISILESDWRYIDKDEKSRFWAAIKLYNTLYFTGMSPYIILRIFHCLISLF